MYAYYVSHFIHNSTVSLKTLYPGGIWTWVFLFLRRMRYPLRHAARVNQVLFANWTIVIGGATYARRGMFEKGIIFFQLISTLFCVVNFKKY
jgi:hypothetical protein